MKGIILAEFIEKLERWQGLKIACLAKRVDY